MTPSVSLPYLFSKLYQMENLFLSIIVLFFPSLLFVIMIPKLAAWKKSRTANSTLKIPPGPMKLPLIGNLHLLVGSLPHHRLRDLAKTYGSLMHLQLGEISNIVVSSAEIAHEMLKTQDVNFSERPFLLAASVYGSISITMVPYGEFWRQLRRICTQELLSPGRVQSFRSIREEEVSNLLRYLHTSVDTPINLTEQIFAMTYGITAKAAFGRKCKDQEAFSSVVREILKIAGGFSLSEVFPSKKFLRRISGLGPKIEKNFKKTDQILERILRDWREEREAKTGEGKGNSLLDVLLNLQENGDLAVPLEDPNIKAILLDIFVAGSDTSSTVLEWAMLEMLRDPRVMEKAQAEVRQVFGGKGKVDETCLHELKYLKLIIKETMRLHPPGPLLLPRESKEDCVINGYYIPAKTKVIINAWAIGRDPNHWTDPEQFYPERFVDSSVDFKGTNFEFIPFGAGRRMCPGITFAMADIEHPLAALLFHFDWRLPGGTAHENLDMTEHFGVTVGRKGGLYLIPVNPYSSSSI
ncbi:cytochrome P450 71D9 [Morus notabilis]|uniref:cytochrome P450 71D9 n=1 Tax=Morus notabilis TaxID=981085 RepID=UPI000CED0A6A|nr:cytochrome P450 71D9 [Morus notabilis]